MHWRKEKTARKIPNDPNSSAAKVNVSADISMSKTVDEVDNWSGCSLGLTHSGMRKYPNVFVLQGNSSGIMENAK